MNNNTKYLLIGLAVAAIVYYGFKKYKLVKKAV